MLQQLHLIQTSTFVRDMAFRQLRKRTNKEPRNIFVVIVIVSVIFVIVAVMVVMVIVVVGVLTLVYFVNTVYSANSTSEAEVGRWKAE